MKTKYILLSVTTYLLLIGNISCSDSFLNEKPYSSYAPETLTDTKGIEASLKGLHYRFGEIWTWSDQQGWLCCWQIGTDVASPGGIQGVEIPFFNYSEMNSENRAVKYMWEKSYQIINTANIIIQALGENGDPEKIAEAKFFRGYMYNTLATLYGNVPLVTTPTATAKTDYVRTALSEVNALIIEDLTYASQHLPDINKVVSESRANKYMAMQALGEVYLRIDNPSEAETVLSTIIDDKKFSLVKARYGKKIAEKGDYFSDIFVFGNQRRSQGNTEAIWTFELEYTKDVPGGYTGAPQHRRVWVPAYHNVPGMTYENSDSLGGRGNGRMRPSNWVKYQLYEEGDIRNSENNIKRHFYYNAPGYKQTIGIDINGLRVPVDSKDAVTTKEVKEGDPVIVAAGDTLESMFPYSTKWNAFDPSDAWGWACIKDFPIMRLGETYLLRAEARYKQNNLQGAADDINVLRERAFGTAYPARGKVDASDITMDFILDERARELFAEENRRMTLMRTKTLLQRAKLNTESTIKGEISGLEEKHLLLPIPLDEILRNKDATLEQNPGYQ